MSRMCFRMHAYACMCGCVGTVGVYVGGWVLCGRGGGGISPIRGSGRYDTHT